MRAAVGVSVSPAPATREPPDAASYQPSKEKLQRVGVGRVIAAPPTVKVLEALVFPAVALSYE